MSEIKCPKCGEVFQVDESDYAAIVKQVRDHEFEQELKAREDSAVQLAVSEAEKQSEKEKNELRSTINQLKANQENATLKNQMMLEQERNTVEELKGKLSEAEKQKQDAVQIAIQEQALKIQKLESDLQHEKDDRANKVEELKNKLSEAERQKEDAVQIAIQDQALKIQKLESDLQHEKDDRANKEQSMREQHKSELALKDEQIAQYRDFKTRQSTKMIGESLEQYCKDEFDKIRTSAFPSAEFDKDNDVRTGSKGDFIFREKSEDGSDILSIMFDMKNEMETTAVKHKNEDFFKKLDKDRREKNCEYAILVSTLEPESELYNTGIVDVSYKYEKMYVVRPQFFITIIMLLRNAALKNLEYKYALMVREKEEIDVTNFYKEYSFIKNDLGKTIKNVNNKHKEAIEQINKAIKDLEKTRDALVLSDKHINTAEGKLEDFTIKRLTRNNPAMAEKFGKLIEE